MSDPSQLGRRDAHGQCTVESEALSKRRRRRTRRGCGRRRRQRGGRRARRRRRSRSRRAGCRRGRRCGRWSAFGAARSTATIAVGDVAVVASLTLLADVVATNRCNARARSHLGLYHRRRIARLRRIRPGTVEDGHLEILAGRLAAGRNESAVGEGARSAEAAAGRVGPTDLERSAFGIEVGESLWTHRAWSTRKATECIRVIDLELQREGRRRVTESERHRARETLSERQCRRRRRGCAARRCRCRRAATVTASERNLRDRRGSAQRYNELPDARNTAEIDGSHAVVSGSGN